ncbi:MAG: Methionyl-tRNA formyltransferase, partial [uncultured Acidimicrobiales bacterium]
AAPARPRGGRARHRPRRHPARSPAGPRLCAGAEPREVGSGRARASHEQPCRRRDGNRGRARRGGGLRQADQGARPRRGPHGEPALLPAASMAGGCACRAGHPGRRSGDRCVLDAARCRARHGARARSRGGSPRSARLPGGPPGEAGRRRHPHAPRRAECRPGDARGAGRPRHLRGQAGQRGASSRLVAPGRRARAGRPARAGVDDGAGPEAQGARRVRSRAAACAGRRPHWSRLPWPHHGAAGGQGAHGRRRLGSRSALDERRTPGHV